MDITNKTLQKTIPMIEKEYGKGECEKIMSQAQTMFDGLVQENIGDNKLVKRHTHKQIFPYIAMYKSMQNNGIPAERALAFLDKCCSEQAMPRAKMMQKVCKIPFMYKIMPKMFIKVTNKMFNSKAGFKAKFYDEGPLRAKFDMTECLYLNVCKKYGCPELTVCFCHTDDVTNGNVHPRLCWNRTKTMGEGKDVCDFDIFVTPKKK